eukprot:5407322-Pleurochrysis_carterae.AAC.1
MGSQERAGDVGVYRTARVGLFVETGRMRESCGVGFGASVAATELPLASDVGASTVMSGRRRRRAAPACRRRCMYSVASLVDMTPMWCAVRDECTARHRAVVG